MMAASQLNSAIKINYAGSGNESLFVYGSTGKCVQITDYSAGVISSNKQFVWSLTGRHEARNGTTILNQYFNFGEVIGGSHFYYTQDHLKSTRELVDETGIVQTRYNSDPSGIQSILQGSVNSDHQFGS